MLITVPAVAHTAEENILQKVSWQSEYNYFIYENAA